ARLRSEEPMPPAATLSTPSRGRLYPRASCAPCRGRAAFACALSRCTQSASSGGPAAVCRACRQSRRSAPSSLPPVRAAMLRLAGLVHRDRNRLLTVLGLGAVLRAAV